MSATGGDLPRYPVRQPIEPLPGPLDTTVHVPGSKSITNRALLVAALADGTSMLDGVLAADDTEAMMSCLGALGVAVDHDPTTDLVVVHGRGGRLAGGAGEPGTDIPPGGPPTGHGAGDQLVAPVALDARQSGTTARFLPPVLALGPGRYRLDGAEQLRARPFGPLFDALRSLGVPVDAAAGDRLPAEITGVGAARWGPTVAISGDVSSQFISGLMMAAPLTPQGLRIELTTPLVSAPYLALTSRVMADFGAVSTIAAAGAAGPVGAGAGAGADAIVVPPGRYRPGRYRVEADASAASYFLAAAAIVGGRVRVDGLGTATTQGDAGFADVLGAMGCTVRRGPDWTEVARAPGAPLRGVEVDMAQLSDTAPTLAAVAPFASGPTRLTGIGFIRHKESDRVGAIVTELRRLGVDAEEEPDGLVVRPAAGAPHGGVVRTYDDHRLAMSFALVGLVVPGVVIDDPGCVAKTFPRFWDVLATLH